MSHRLVVAVLIAFGSALPGILGLQAQWFGALQAQAEDVLQPGTETVSDVVVVAIDRRTLNSVGGGWPWPRERHAELLDAIGRAGASLVLYDVLFADGRPGDDILAEALGRTRAVLASALTLRPRSAAPPVVLDRVGPPDELVRAAEAVGHTNVASSSSRGVVRELPFYALTERGVVEPSMVLAAVARLDEATHPVERRGGVQVGRRFVPLDRGHLRINWSSSLTATDAVAAADVLSGEVGRSRLANRTVIVGVTEPTVADLHLVAVDKSGSTPGVVVVANALNTVLSRAYLRGPRRGLQESVILVAGALTAAVFVYGSLRRAAIVSIVGTAAYVAGTTWRFHVEGELWNVVWPVLVVATAAATGTVWRYVAERRGRMHAVELVSQYVPAPVARRLVDRHAGGLPEGRLTFLMTDIVGSTATWEEAPEIMRAAAARHDTLVERAVEAHNGALVRPRGEGDSRFAVFLSGQDAAEAALDISDAMARERWRTPAGIRLRIGLSAGEAELRAGDYYGPDVNRCARIRSIARPGQALASESVAAGLGPPVETVDIGVHQLRDITRPERLFEIRRRSSASDTT